MNTPLTPQQLQRYNRTILLQGIGSSGQQKLLNSRVLIIGAGGLGSPIALYLAAAGVGTIGIADADTVDLSNLQRQILHATANIGQPKVLSARQRILALNPELTVNTYQQRIDHSCIEQIIAPYDFVIDATDSFESKFLINDGCVLGSKPFSHGAVVSFIGQTMTVLPRQSCCYRCIFDRPPPPNEVPNSAQIGILGAVAGLLGTLQALEAIKFLTNSGELLTNTLLTCDTLTMNLRKVPFKQNPRCPLCGDAPTITQLREGV
jgi:molybdopterin/thiamine biosynthesis adenylyltransferase